MRVTHRLLATIFVLGNVILAVFIGVNFWQGYQRNIDARKLGFDEHLSLVTQEPNPLFREIMSLSEGMSQRFLESYRSSEILTQNDFNSLYQLDEQGAYRLKESLYYGIDVPGLGRVAGLSSMVAANQSVDNMEFQRRLIMAERTLARYAALLHPRGLNFHVTYPENAITLYLPEFPWGLKSRHDLKMNEGSTIRATFIAENPQRKPVWSGLYLDKTVGKWMVTFSYPVDDAGRHLLNFCLDVPLASIRSHLLESTVDGAVEFVINAEGGLVAHPDVDPNDFHDKSIADLSDVVNEKLATAISAAIADHVNSEVDAVYHLPEVIDDTGVLIAATNGANWYRVLTYSTKDLREMAQLGAKNIILSSSLLFCLFYLVTLLVIRRYVREPLEHISVLLKALKQDKYRDVIDNRLGNLTNTNDEFSELKDTIVRLAGQVDSHRNHLERLVQERTAELEIANLRLQEANDQLAELSRNDALTGLMNRRTLEFDITRLMQSLDQHLPVSIIMVDVDHFKWYNDTYGHQAGDVVLKRVAVQLQQTVGERARVYRYGGEEFLLIVTGLKAGKVADLASELCSAILGLAEPNSASEMNYLTVSVGVATFEQSGRSITDLIREADHALYRAKENGRNGVFIYSEAELLIESASF